MRSGRFSLWQRILSVWMCALLVVSGVPRTLAWAEEPKVAGAAGTTETFGATETFTAGEENESGGSTEVFRATDPKDSSNATDVADTSGPADVPENNEPVDAADDTGASSVAAPGDTTGEADSAEAPKTEDVPTAPESVDAAEPTKEEGESEEEPPSEPDTKQDETDGESDPAPEAAPESAKDPDPASDSAPDSASADKTDDASDKTDDESGKAPVYASGTLSKKLKSDDDRTYVIEVSYGEDARIPEGAELRASLISDDDAAAKDVPQRMERALGLGADDRVLATTYVDISIEADGQPVKPATALDVTVRTNAIKPSHAAFVEVVAMGDGSDTSAVDPTAPSDDSDAANDQRDKDEDGQPAASDPTSEAPAALVDEAIVPSNLTPNKADAHATTLSFSASGLGTIALASVATRWDAWAGKGMTVSLLVPRHGLAVSMQDVAQPELPEGVDLLAVGAVQADPNPAYGASLWLEVQPTDATSQKDGLTGGTLVYVLDGTDDEGIENTESEKDPKDVASNADGKSAGDAKGNKDAKDVASNADDKDDKKPADDKDASGAKVNKGDTDDIAPTNAADTTDDAASADAADHPAHVPGQVVAGPEGTQEPVELLANRDRVLLVWDSGYRNTTLSMDAVTVEGMMPEDTAGSALDVSKDFAQPESLTGGLTKKAAKAVAAGTREVETLAAYDITLTADGEEYQPDDKHPLTVRIASDALGDAIDNGQDVQLWHIDDDGKVEVIKNAVYANRTVTFEAPGFSTYLLVAQSDTPATPTVLSSTFRINARAKTYARASTVTFVNTDKSPIMGTMTGTLNVTFTGGGSESNDTNTIDVYGFIDKLDPAIIDEYDFSRVYVQLTATNEKDFRYIQVGDGTAIATNGDPNIYRAYFYMDSIAQNAAGQDYHGTWYQLSNGGDMDKIYIEYYHVAPAAFHALDTRNDPVEGAEYSLYMDEDCYVPLEYKHAEVKATSDSNGLVSFGKIPRGTYYMKETVMPEGYKKSTSIYTIVVDGQTEIPNVIHEDDDGSVIISDVLRMKLTKEWDDGADKHKDDSVEVVVYARGEPICDPIVLSEKNDWTHTLYDLDPNEPYMVSETSVSSHGEDVTTKWIPTISYEELDPHIEYYHADDFKKNKQYVVITKTSGGTRALADLNGLTTTPLAANAIQVTGNVTDAMLWNVDGITKDGVIALQNVATGKYLDKGSKWYVNPVYPVPLYIRHINNGGVVKFYHRPNLNSAVANYLYVWYDGSKEGATDNYSTYESFAAKFDLYRKVNVRNVDVTIANKTSRYPMRIKNVTYPSATPLSDTTFDLYTQEQYSVGESATPYISGLTADDEGFLRDGDKADLELSAGTYYLRQTGYASGYARSAAPTKFTITRAGVLKVAQDDQEIAGFAYTSTYKDGDATLPLLQVPNWIPTTFEVAMEVEGTYADKSRGFEIAVTVPDGMARLVGTIDGKEVVLTGGDATVSLAHGQTLRFEGVPATVDYVLTQTKVEQYETQAKADTPDTVTVGVADGETFVVTLSDLQGTAADPAHVTITNSLPDRKVFATGQKDNAPLWTAVALLFTAALVAFCLLCRRART